MSSEAAAEWLSLDYETRSTVDLRRAGLYRYAEHATTDIICACFAFDEEPVQTWLPGQPVTNRFADHVASGGKIRGYNVNFERIIWRHIASLRYGWPLPKTAQLWDTAAQAATLSLPRSLDGVAMALRMRLQKDREGHNLMMRMCRPRSYAADGTPVWWDDPDKIARLVAYCARDVEVERAIANRLRQISPSERTVFLLDARINDRGAKIDLPLVAAAQKIVASATLDLDRQMKTVTKGVVPKCTNVAKLTAWLIAQGVAIPTRPLTKDEIAKLEKEIGELIDSGLIDEADEQRLLLAERRKGKPTLAKAAMRELLARDDLPADCAAAIRIREEAAKSSTAKLTAMEKAVCADGRLRGAFLYHGTGPGRWTGKLVQPANLPRGTVPAPFAFIPDILAGRVDRIEPIASPLGIVSSLLRGCFVPKEGYRLIVVDYSAIQARITPWVAGERWKLDAFRAYDAKTGPDPYKIAASQIYRVAPGEVTKAQRQVGKVAELTCGFGGGVNAFQSMAALYDVEVDNDEADAIKNAWREAHPATADFKTGLWRQLEDAAMAAVKRPGIVTVAAHGLIRFKVAGDWLFMILPSGRPIAYAFPSIRDTTRPWGDELPSVCFWAVDSLTKQWTLHSTYGGKLTENVAMGIERDLLVGAMIRLENAGYPICLHNYDEIVCEVPLDFGSVDEVAALMTQGEAWCGADAGGVTGALPIKAAGQAVLRYQKLD